MVEPVVCGPGSRVGDRAGAGSRGSLMKILMTGATGFIGRHLLSFWKGRHEVFALVRDLPPKQSEGSVRYVNADLTRPLDVQRLPAGIEAIVHLAQANVAFPEAAGE